MKSLYIHGGNLKTGSTSIQSFIRRNLRKINSGGRLFVPVFENNPAAHANLCRELPMNSEPLKPWPKWADAATEMDRNAADSYLLTNEIFIRARANDVLAKLNECGPFEPRFFFYLRPHIEMFTSSYLQEVKTGFCSRPAALVLDSFVKRREIDFVTAIDDYVSVFGRDAVACREYARDNFVGEDVVEDFFDFIGCTDVFKSIGEVEPVEANVSPSAEVVALLLHFRQYLPPEIPMQRYLRVRQYAFNPLNIALGRALGPEYQTKYLPPVGIQERLKALFETGRVELVDRINLANTTAKWADEPVRKPLPPKDPPLDLVRDAFLMVADRADQNDARGISALMKDVAERLPAEEVGGVKHIPLRKLRPQGIKN